MDNSIIYTQVFTEQYMEIKTLMVELNLESKIKRPADSTINKTTQDIDLSS